ncbi:Asp-tRNA(Asn)/Glu-tRNA(Gln) amidotransferase subunit GatC [Leptospira biflexa]|jgi:aspartyl-tRNA(Asn)/glutamyl-tRNA(Gln) amidotransferase subunit C|uniref:Asp-tRNA(Asn)/Glu-tRNA(Gln) amidotransferase subunit GatC n=1 Tax=Leptospira biflexa TaxID=172 RepID=UPI001083E485|nr:Asp-tRNA(Asn)/Glu-tRNA(Gln) amidotransferase subunit GatC [Leptospira biflexa]TGM36878.1 Asp-tRNA(Asn)/Glu-tRNA(Gln) amidotransferase subunit GatC [Leptospira biflexa]TGM39861.1 Asp-tRNA(Asn)/Glu-tRNA(Gln) amidotransferase subunit GatC [Leptospira biflexa]TGM48548.1 Asp-tRNA(Asn)/Glu-tRNA(Gln) amidotransferase subunit GatC [Leptospira biflexa]TGM48987.1 Asp-tRNA(Asn)/Glu-tRNA(Gln) amidotransferase subunit GatC [Leptospira biflexa]TGM54258.1 Asp-tRNA(Asn)/Glu-tRNA(Gln) amidotransferase subun
MDEKELKNIANLAKLNIEENEISGMLSDFSRIVQYVDEIKNLDTSKVGDDEIYEQIFYELRKDLSENSLKREDLSKISPSYENGYVVVPKVIET